MVVSASRLAHKSAALPRPVSSKRRSSLTPRVFMKEYRRLDGVLETRVEKVGDGSIVCRFDKTPFPESQRDVVCPHFLALKWATGCPYRCAWCYLQGTLRFLEEKKNPRVKDFQKIECHLRAFLEEPESPPELINAGELADSLMTEKSDMPFSGLLIETFLDQNRHRVLTVSKSNAIDNILRSGRRDVFVTSFSLNAEGVAKKWERAPRVIERINAARDLKNAGFEVRFRIDPIVPVDDWREEYSGLLDLIFSNVVPDRITLGSLRGLQSTINNSKDRSWVGYLEENSNWGKKVGYGKRLEMYRFITRILEEKLGFKNFALCKETIEVWNGLGLDFRKIRCNCTW